MSLPCDLGDEEQWNQLQRELAGRVREVDDDGFSVEARVRLVAGVDISADLENPRRVVGSLAVLSFPDLVVRHVESLETSVDIPYVPGYLGIREAPIAVELLKRMDGHSLQPDVVLCDGNGLMHPRGAGLAVHVGVLADIPTVGVSKNFFAIDGITPPRHGHGPPRTTPLRGQSGRLWGAALWTNERVSKPIIISVGHRISLESAIEVVRRASRFRVPEPIRAADQWSRRSL
mmetsp:Transcript_11661/g.23710  ORF Transcript_11661/g.23710 Transcript_11661/m.23710 type:complete len:232 (+) Transcript_11661:2188-2883(+)